MKEGFKRVIFGIILFILSEIWIWSVIFGYLPGSNIGLILFVALNIFNVWCVISGFCMAIDELYITGR